MRVTQFFVRRSRSGARFVEPGSAKSFVQRSAAAPAEPTAPGAAAAGAEPAAPADQQATVRAEVAAQPEWQPFTEYAGQPLRGVELVELGRSGAAELQLVRIAAGGHFAMHASPDTAFCQIVEGAGTLRLPGGATLPYTGPELYVFHPHTLHEWIDVTADTLLSVCLVATPEPGAGS